jgi:hypothetical protein
LIFARIALMNTPFPECYTFHMTKRTSLSFAAIIFAGAMILSNNAQSFSSVLMDDDVDVSDPASSHSSERLHHHPLVYIFDTVLPPLTSIDLPSAQATLLPRPGKTTLTVASGSQTARSPPTV